MDRTQKIKEKLTTILKREPTTNELVNAQTDFNLMMEVMKDEVDELQLKTAELDTIKNDINVLKLKAK